MTTPREDALTLGARIKAEEKAAREHRIANVLGPHELGYERDVRFRIAAALYSARWDGRAYWEEPTAQELLDDFCGNLFGASFEEVMVAWDAYLGTG